MLLSIDLYEDLVDVEGVAVYLVLSLQTPGVERPELDAPKENRFSAYRDTSLYQLTCLYRLDAQRHGGVDGTAYKLLARRKVR